MQQGGSNSSAGLTSTPATLLASIAAASSNSTAHTPAITFHRPWSLADESFLIDGVNAGRSFEEMSSSMPAGARTAESCHTYWQHAMIGAGKVNQLKQQAGIEKGDGAAAAGSAPRWVLSQEPRPPIFNSSRSTTSASARQNEPPAAVAAAASCSNLVAANAQLTLASRCNATAASAAAAARRGKCRRWSFAAETFLLDGANSGRSFADLARNLPGGPRTADSCRQHWQRAMVGKGRVVQNHAAAAAAAAGAELEGKAKPTRRRSTKYAREVAAGLDSDSDGDEEEEEDGPSPAAAAAATGSPHQPRTLRNHIPSSNAATTATRSTNQTNNGRSEQQVQTGGEEKEGRSEQPEVASSSPLSSPLLSPALAAAANSSATPAASPALPPLHWRVRNGNYPGFTVHTHTASLTEVRRLFNARVQLEMREPREEICPPPMTQAWLLMRKGEWKAVDKPSIALLFADPTFLAERRAAAAAAGLDGMCMILRFEVGNHSPEGDGMEQERQQDQESAGISQLGKARRSRKPAAAIASSAAASSASSAAANEINKSIAMQLGGSLSAEPRPHRGRWPKFKPSFARARFTPIATPLLAAWAADYAEFLESGIARTDREGIVDWFIDNIQHKTKLPTLQSASDFFQVAHPGLPVPKREDDPDVKAAALQPSVPLSSEVEMEFPSPPPQQNSSKSLCSGCYQAASVLSAAGFCYDCSLRSSEHEQLRASSSLSQRSRLLRRAATDELSGQPSVHGSAAVWQQDWMTDGSESGEEDSEGQSPSSASSSASFKAPASRPGVNRQQKNRWTNEEDDTLLSCLNQGLRASIQKRLAKLGRPYSRTQASAITHFSKLKAAGLVRSRPSTEEERAAGMVETVWVKVAPQKKGEETASTDDRGEEQKEEAEAEVKQQIEVSYSSELGDPLDVLATAAVAEAGRMDDRSANVQAGSEDVRPSKKFKHTVSKGTAESQQQQDSFVAAKAAELVDIASGIRDSPALSKRSSSDDPCGGVSGGDLLDGIVADVERLAFTAQQFATDLKELSQSRKQRKGQKRARAATPVIATPVEAASAEAIPLAAPLQGTDFSTTSPTSLETGPVAMEVDGAAAAPAVAAAAPAVAAAVPSPSPTFSFSTPPSKRAPSLATCTSQAMPNSDGSVGQAAHNPY